MLGNRLALLISTSVRPGEHQSADRDERPHSDYCELADATGAEVVDYSRIAGEGDMVLDLVQRRLGRGWAQALWAVRHRDQFPIFWSDSERVGLPLAMLLKAARAKNGHVMVGHWLSPPAKALPLRLLRLHSHIDRIACRIALQRDVAVALGVPAARLAVVPRGVDARFWRPMPAPQHNLVSATGLERRDYQTLVAAARESGFETVITAASPWFDRDGLDGTRGLPPNVKVEQFGFARLRELYAQSRAVVVPLFDHDFQAGITVVLEAMAMGKPVIVSRTKGQVGAGVVRHRENGLYVTPGDPRELRQAIDFLIEHPDEAARMGRAGRELIEEGLTIGHFVARTKSLIEPLARPGQPTEGSSTAGAL